VLVATNQHYVDTKGALLGGNNMAAIHLARAVGGDILLGFISAVAFATILAVVSGLTLAGATAVSHDLYASVFRRGRINELQEIRASKAATIVLGVVSIILGILFEKQNIAFMVGLAFAIAASANFPVLLLSIYWKRLSTRGALVGGLLGLVTAVALTVVGPAIWVKIFGFEKAVFPYDAPALFSMPLAFAGCWLVSVFDHSVAAKAEHKRFEAQYVRSQTGIGAEGAASH